jgi:molybdopterin/thiamine biosynthesis adenylyltransferase
MVVGVGGLGCPAALSLVRAGVGRVVLVDDDVVDESNLHRQILFSDEDIGKDKLDAARRVLLRRGGSERGIELVRSRLLPDNARELVRSVDVVLEGADNFATKFLAADACHLERRAIVHAAAIRWNATIWAVAGQGAPCYRCLFEDLPAGVQQSCDDAGVIGPMVGLAGALAADLALRILVQGDPPYSKLYAYDGKADRLREVEVAPRSACPLCGPRPEISEIEKQRYISRLSAD